MIFKDFVFYKSSRKKSKFTLDIQKRSKLASRKQIIILEINKWVGTLTVGSNMRANTRLWITNIGLHGVFSACSMYFYICETNPLLLCLTAIYQNVYIWKNRKSQGNYIIKLLSYFRNNFIIRSLFWSPCTITNDQLK